MAVTAALYADPPVQKDAFAEAARIYREGKAALKDKSYRKYPIGQEWGRFLRAKRLSGRADNTRVSYETVARLFTLHFADLPDLEPFCSASGVELVLDFLDFTHHQFYALGRI